MWAWRYEHTGVTTCTGARRGFSAGELLLWKLTLTTSRPGHQILVAIFSSRGRGTKECSQGRDAYFEKKGILSSLYLFHNKRGVNMTKLNFRTLCCILGSLCELLWLLLFVELFLQGESFQELSCFWTWWSFRDRQESCKPEIEELKQLRRSNIQRGCLRLTSSIQEKTITGVPWPF